MEIAEMVGNILRKYETADDFALHHGTYWYPDAHLFAESLGNGTLEDTYAFSGIIAAFSPLTPWQRNVMLAERAASVSTPSEVMSFPTLGTARKAAFRILAGEDWNDVLKGLKVRAFASGIWHSGNADDVCVDVHAKDVAYGVPFTGVGNKRTTPSNPRNISEYRAIAEAYTIAAHEIGIGPQTLQAIVWTAQCGKAA